MTISKTTKQVSLVLVGRKSQAIAGIGILRRGKPFTVSDNHAKKLLAATVGDSNDPLFLRESDAKERQEIAKGGNPLDLGLGADKPAASSKPSVDIEEA